MMNCRWRYHKQSGAQYVILVGNGMLLNTSNYLNLGGEGVGILVAPM